MIKQKFYIKKTYLFICLSICSSFCFAQTCNSLTLDSITNPGVYNIASITESDGIRNGPDYFGATIYYPIDATAPFPSIVIVPGYTALQFSIQSWGPFLASHGIVTMTIGTNNVLENPISRKDALLDAMITLRGENTRANSPLIGNIDLEKMAVGGWSMGGGGAQLAAVVDPSIKAVLALCPWLSTLSTPNLNHSAPVLIFSAELDAIAPPAFHADIHYNNTPVTTNKLIYEINNAGHTVANSPTGAQGSVGKIGLSWLKYHLIGDDCYCPLFLDTPSTASDYMTNVVCPTITLPVELTKFTGYQANNQIYLNWETASETNNQTFQIEYGNDGRNWEEIGFVNGQGTVTRFNQYELIHKNPNIGENYYRLKQIDYDGNYAYSKVINIKWIDHKEVILTPNPTAGIIKIEGIQEGKITILNTSGRIVKEQLISSDEIDISDFSAGIYFIQIISDNQSFSKRILKQ
jgi:dienelactone hydrolase